MLAVPRGLKLHDSISGCMGKREAKQRIRKIEITEKQREKELQDTGTHV